MNSNDTLELIERYYEGKLNATEQAEFAQKLRDEPAFAQAVAEYETLMRGFSHYAERLSLQKKINEFHQELSLEGADNQLIIGKSQNKNLWRKYAPALTLAASVALISIFTTIFTLNSLRNWEKEQTAQYRALRRDLQEVKKGQNESPEATAYSSKPTKQYGATAFVVSANGYLITNQHVVKNADSIQIEAQVAGKIQKLSVEVVYVDSKTDLAVLQVIDKNFKGFPNLPYAFRSVEADLGEEVYTLAYPRRELVYGEGAISAKTGYKGDTTAYQISIPVNPGNSGSPLLDNMGNVIGVVSGKQTNMEGATFAVKAKYLLTLFAKINQKKPQLPLYQPQWNYIQYLRRPDQIKHWQNFVFEVKVFDSK
ncbi:MAG: serine protease [Microscillaceae bacterium]|jgi:S1-C subfamily serine protease|nr:serine protease [Microscillaceae bacterium]